ncbi:hypothetical protein GCM10011519_23130 [Marmoricola endophyticus]|uniref:Uncharacterized protein n=1 Tax=Marmoricola endophyticus TaxID=2040280 RepID=A0A917BJQ2_9ACTN|nr:hypothetical protein [Marmoricola endophyticus]GGF48487.1 hypothetical protein GCM10011519_23130 [Marmoricola endophyticus]
MSGTRVRRAEPVSASTLEQLSGGRRTRAALLVPWVLVVVAALAVLVADRVATLPGPVSTGGVRTAAVVLTAACAAALAHRAGGRPFATTVVVGVLAVVAVVWQEDSLLAGLSVLTAVLAGAFAVAVTEPAAGAVAAVREAVLALVVASGGALGVAAYTARLDPSRLRLAALAAALVVVLLLADHLGPGLAGLGTLARAALLVGLLVGVGAVAYGEALGRWGSAGLIDLVADTRRTVQDVAYAVPVPLPALLGVPALVYGTWLRGRARQGWWVCAFGVGATVPVAAALADPRLEMARAVLGLGYSALIGLLIGLLVVRVDRWLTHS